MTDIELVIKMSEKVYEELKRGLVCVRGQRSGKTLLSELASAIHNGKPLPKGHGRLIDVSDIEWAKFTRETSRYEEAMCVDWDVVENAPTIIEASE